MTESLDMLTQGLVEPLEQEAGVVLSYLEQLSRHTQALDTLRGLEERMAALRATGVSDVDARVIELEEKLIDARVDVSKAPPPRTDALSDRLAAGPQLLAASALALVAAQQQFHAAAARQLDKFLSLNWRRITLLEHCSTESTAVAAALSNYVESSLLEAGALQTSNGKIPSAVGEDLLAAVKGVVSGPLGEATEAGGEAVAAAAERQEAEPRKPLAEAEEVGQLRADLAAAQCQIRELEMRVRALMVPPATTPSPARVGLNPMRRHSSVDSTSFAFAATRADIEGATVAGDAPTPMLAQRHAAHATVHAASPSPSSVTREAPAIGDEPACTVPASPTIGSTIAGSSTDYVTPVGASPGTASSSSTSATTGRLQTQLSLPTSVALKSQRSITRLEAAASDASPSASTTEDIGGGSAVSYGLPGENALLDASSSESEQITSQSTQGTPPALASGVRLDRDDMVVLSLRRTRSASQRRLARLRLAESLEGTLENAMPAGAQWRPGDVPPPHKADAASDEPPRKPDVRGQFSLSSPQAAGGWSEQLSQPVAVSFISANVDALSGVSPGDIDEGIGGVTPHASATDLPGMEAAVAAEGHALDLENIDDSEYLAALFKLAGGGPKGVAASEAMSFLATSGLPLRCLAEVWTLARAHNGLTVPGDDPQSTSLPFNAFSDAVLLVGFVQAGYPLSEEVLDARYVSEWPRPTFGAAAAD